MDDNHNEGLNVYNWRAQPPWDEVKDREMIQALNLLSTNTLQWVHQLLHDLEAGGYSTDLARETLHDAVALVLDHRGEDHKPSVRPALPNYRGPWLTRASEYELGIVG